MTRRLFPHPFLSLVLLAVWLMLVNRIALNSVLFGALVGFVIPHLTKAYWPERRMPVRIGKSVTYLLLVIYDIVRANISVAMIVLFKPNDQMQPAWVVVPLDVTRPEAITALAATITLTPGTLSCDLSEGGTALLVHCLHAPDPDDIVADIKLRYEARLKEIFI